MKIAYVTTDDSSDVHAWSGSTYYILKTLQDIGFETEAIGNLAEGQVGAWLSRAKKSYYRRIERKTYLPDREPITLRNYSAQVAKSLKHSDSDLVFSPGTIPIARLRTDKPIVFWTDATFAGMHDFYPGFSNLCRESIRHGNKTEQEGLSRCRLAIFSSKWAADTALRHYDVDSAKVKVVPFGANIDCDRDQSDIVAIAESKEFDTCKLLFLGVDWPRKGGDTALKVAAMLNQNGIRTELHVAGCEVPKNLPEFVINHGFVSKKTEAGRRHLDRLFRESHFLILPTLADCVPVVFAEASSYGLPSLTTRVGGIQTAINEGKNGYTFPLDEKPEAYCEIIERHLSSREIYLEFALSSFQEYTTKLNWSSAGKSVAELMRGCLR